jgi:hypothetical protein
VRFLIDECLTVDLVTVAGQSGHEAQHVAHVGRAGWKDWNVVRYARDGDFILVTNNASDFRESTTPAKSPNIRRHSRSVFRVVTAASPPRRATSRRHVSSWEIASRTACRAFASRPAANR